MRALWLPAGESGANWYGTDRVPTPRRAWG